MRERTSNIARTNPTYRVAVSGLFFLQGLCFASWASRIPTIQASLHLSHTALGALLLALPVGSLLGLPLAGALVTRFGSRRVVSWALVLYAALLLCIGAATTVPALLAVLVGFGLVGNTANIAMNTQAVGVEARYRRPIMASFHGLWSLAGFTAAGIGTYMIGNDIRPLAHFAGVAAFILVGLAACLARLLPNEERPSGPQKLFTWPGKPLLRLGLLAFCCMLAEGCMFDWSGIYFERVVQAPAAWVGAGYTAFMATMATGRFLADGVAQRLGFSRTVQLSGALITAGLLLSVTVPDLPYAIAGFLLVGFGVSSVVPLVFSEAGRTATGAPGIALAAVSSIAFFGFLSGPPLIGFIGGLFGLRVSFAGIAAVGLLVLLLARTYRPAEKQRAQPKTVTHEPEATLS
ncbi:MFS transporter [Flaviaesturariibacter amylovorans]|uniref:MFS transporter n=1 Tax=Flaviaesturariibacter amylovorans TaxID=1084520 RepID=A0ABP8H8J8_9BACT